MLEGEGWMRVVGDLLFLACPGMVGMSFVQMGVGKRDEAKGKVKGLKGLKRAEGRGGKE